MEPTEETYSVMLIRRNPNDTHWEDTGATSVHEATKIVRDRCQRMLDNDWKIYGFSKSGSGSESNAS